MIKKLIYDQYGLEIKNMSRLLTGVGGQTYLLETNNGKYIMKGVPSNNEYFENEPLVVEFLKEKCIPVAEYIKNKFEKYFFYHDNIVYHIQKYVEGETLPYNHVPDWFLNESAEILGKIHSSLSIYKQLPIGMGDGFLRFMKSNRPQNSYLQSIEKAKKLNDNEILEDVKYRLSQVDHLKDIEFDLTKFTCCNTHGDYKSSQIICKDNKIAAVIDWSTACVHPVCWEIIRSYTYADPACKDGKIEADRFIKYINAYLKYHTLNEYDIKMMSYFFYCQILACDYYGQYYASTDTNKDDFLFQAKFATKLIKWFEHNVSDLSKKLYESCFIRRDNIINPEKNCE